MAFIKQLPINSLIDNPIEYNWTFDVEKLDLAFQLSYDPLADTLETDARRRFIEADRLYFLKSNKHIDINEGSTAEGNARRSCSRQMQLWMGWSVMKLPGYAKANLPGCSHHNYGVAADLRYVTDEMKEILLSQGWSDIYHGEEWHFTCIESNAFKKIEAKINELRNGISQQWAQDMTVAYELNKKKNSFYTELKVRQKKFEGEALEFNRQVKIYNDAKLQFQTETLPQAQRRDEILIRLSQHDQRIAQLEKLYVEFRNVADEIIERLSDQIDEIRRLMALPVEQIHQVISSKVPADLRARYDSISALYFATAQQIKNESDYITSLINSLNSQTGGFENKAVVLLQQYEFLKNLRTTLDNEKQSVERGFVDVQLMSNESFLRMNRAAQLFEKIEAEVKTVSI